MFVNYYIFFSSRIHGSYIDEPSMNQLFDLVICLHFIIRGQVSLVVKTSDLGTGPRFNPGCLNLLRGGTVAMVTNLALN